MLLTECSYTERSLFSLRIKSRSIVLRFRTPPLVYEHDSSNSKAAT